MVIHFAIAIKNQFNLSLMTGLFIIGGILGWYLKTYESGFVFGVIASLMFW
jgi:hypothetical protein